MTRMEKYRETADYIQSRIPFKPQLAVVLGSGLGDYTDQLENPVTLEYKDIPHFPLPQNESHKGTLFAGAIGGKGVLLMAGRFHHYEGYSFEECAYYIPVFQLLGVQTLIVTNAAGGINPSFAAGDLMLITDHIKLTALSPVTAFENGLFGPRFFDMGDAYAKRLQAIARGCAEKTGVPLRQGVYAYMGGPQFETPAEIRMLSALGADAVGMSTVPEAIMAAYCGIRLLGISCISNLAAGLSPVPLSDDDVREVAARVAGRFATLLDAIIAEI